MELHVGDVIKMKNSIHVEKIVGSWSELEWILRWNVWDADIELCCHESRWKRAFAVFLKKKMKKIKKNRKKVLTF